MMSSYRRWFAVIGMVIALAMVSACGGQVVMDTSGGTGGTGGGDVAGLSACNEYCEARETYCTEEGSCMDRCLERVSYVGPCESEYEARVLCIAAHLPSEPQGCKQPIVACDASLDALMACVYPAGPCEIGKCKVGGLDPGDPAMKCDIVCGGVVYTSACEHEDIDSPYDCVCQIDGEAVGTCQGVTPEGAGKLGCCSAYFAESQ